MTVHNKGTEDGLLRPDYGQERDEKKLSGNHLELSCVWELRVGSWELGVGSWELGY